MVTVSIQLEDSVAAFYSKIAEINSLNLETVLEDALFKLAGELSLEALRRIQCQQARSQEPGSSS